MPKTLKTLKNTSKTPNKRKKSTLETYSEPIQLLIGIIIAISFSLFLLTDMGFIESLISVLAVGFVISLFSLGG